MEVLIWVVLTPSDTDKSLEGGRDTPLKVGLLRQDHFFCPMERCCLFV